MIVHQFSIPFSVDLSKEQNWSKAQDHPYGYWIIRCHFQVRERQADDPAIYGRKLAIIETGDGIEPEIVHSIKTKLAIMEVKESFYESILQEESLQKFCTSLASSIGAMPSGKISTEVKSEAQTRLTECFKQSFRIHHMVTQEEEREYRLSYKVSPSITTRLAAVAMFQRYVYDIYLTWVDYLSVRYTKGPFAIRKKRTKRPKLENGNHVNWIKFNIPLASVSVWRPLPDSAVVIPEASYHNEVEGDEIKIGAPETVHQFFAARPEISTLYQISNAAFPLKWIKRNTEWTEEELKKIEEGEPDEVRWIYEKPLPCG